MVDLMHRAVLLVHQSVGQLVSALKDEPVDKWTQKLIYGLTLMICRTSSMAKVKGQGYQVKTRLYEAQVFMSVTQQ